MRNAVFAVLAAVGSFASASADQVAEAEKLKIGASIEAQVQKVIAGANAADIDAAMASISSSPDYRAVDNGAIYTNRDALVTAYREGYSRLRSQDIRLIEQSTLVLAHDLAVYTARGTFTSTSKSGETTPVTPFAWTILWRLESGAWKQLNVHQSFGRPAAP